MDAGNEVSITPDSSAKEHLRLLVIFAVLVSLIALPTWLWTRHEKNRPALVEVRIVSATSEDPVYREGARSVDFDTTVSLAVALRLNYPGKGDTWLSPVDEVFLDGRPVDHLKTNRWPEDDRVVRVFWFTLEAPFLGGTLTPQNAPEKLAFQTFLAPELGRGLKAEGEPESHADDGVNLGNELLQVDAGTYRLYARAEVVTRAGSSHHVHMATSIGADAVNDPRLLRISRRLDPRLGVEPVAGEYFRLPGFEVEDHSGLDIQDLVRKRMATSSLTFAAAAVTGRPSFDHGTLDHVADFGWDNGKPDVSGAPIRWGTTILPRDLIRNGRHWIVAVRDDGDGVFGPGDLVAQSWRRHAAVLPLGAALDDDTDRLQIHRFSRGTQ